jgi:hypothetical protein
MEFTGNFWHGSQLCRHDVHNIAPSTPPPTDAMTAGQIDPAAHPTPPCFSHAESSARLAHLWKRKVFLSNTAMLGEAGPEVLTRMPAGVAAR